MGVLLPSYTPRWLPLLKGVAAVTLFAFTFTSVIPSVYAQQQRAPAVEKEHLRTTAIEESPGAKAGLEEALKGSGTAVPDPSGTTRRAFVAQSAGALVGALLGVQALPAPAVAQQPPIEGARINPGTLPLKDLLARSAPGLAAGAAFIRRQKITGAKPILPANIPADRLPPGFRGFDFNGFYVEYAPGARDKFLTDYGRTWIYTQALVLYDLVAQSDLEATRELADALVRLGKDEEALGFKGGWHFSYNTREDPWLDPRAPTGNNLWALSALYNYMIASKDFRHLKWVNATRARVLDQLQLVEKNLPSLRKDDLRYGLVLGMSYTEALDSSNIDAIGYRAYEGNFNKVAGDVATEHQFDAINTFRLAYLANEAASRGTEGKEPLQPLVDRHKILLENLGRLWVKDAAKGGHFITGIHYNKKDQRWERNLSIAVDNNSWAGVILPYNEEMAWSALQFVRKEFVFRQKIADMQDLPPVTQAKIRSREIDPNERVAGTTFFDPAFIDRFIADIVPPGDPDRVVWGRMLQPEATFGYIHFLAKFAQTTRDPERRARASALAQELLKGMTRLQELYGGEGLPYATLTPKLFTTLLSTTATATMRVVVQDLRSGQPSRFLMVDPPEAMRRDITIPLGRAGLEEFTVDLSAVPQPAMPMSHLLGSGLEEVVVPTPMPHSLQSRPISPADGMFPTVPKLGQSFWAARSAVGVAAPTAGLEESPEIKISRRQFLATSAAATAGAAAAAIGVNQAVESFPEALEQNVPTGTPLPSRVLVSRSGNAGIVQETIQLPYVDVPVYVSSSSVLEAEDLPVRFLERRTHGITAPDAAEMLISSLEMKQVDGRTTVSRTSPLRNTTVVPPTIFEPSVEQEVWNTFEQHFSRVRNWVRRHVGDRPAGWRAPWVGAREIAIPLWDPWVLGHLPDDQVNNFFKGMEGHRILYGTSGALNWQGYATYETARDVAEEVVRHQIQAKKADAKISPLMGAPEWGLSTGKSHALQQIQLLGFSYPLFDWDQVYLDVKVWTTSEWVNAVQARDMGRLKKLAWDWYQLHQEALDRLSVTPARLYTFVPTTPASNDPKEDPLIFVRMLRKALDDRHLDWDSRIVPVGMAYTDSARMNLALQAATTVMGTPVKPAFNLMAEPIHPERSLYENFRSDPIAAEDTLRSAVQQSGSDTVVLHVASTLAAMTLGTGDRVSSADRWVADPRLAQHLAFMRSTGLFFVGEPEVRPLEERARLPVPESTGDFWQRQRSSLDQGLETGPFGAASPYRFLQMVADLIHGRWRWQFDSLPGGTETTLYRPVRLVQGYFGSVGAPRVTRVEVLKGTGRNVQPLTQNVLGNNGGIFLPASSGPLTLRVTVNRGGLLRWQSVELYVGTRIGSGYWGSGSDAQREDWRTLKMPAFQNEGNVDIPLSAPSSGTVFYNVKLVDQENRVVEWVGSGQDPGLMASGWPYLVEQSVGGRGEFETHREELQSEKSVYRGKSEQELLTLNRPDLAAARRALALNELGVIAGGRLPLVARMRVDEAVDGAQLERSLQTLRASGVNILSLRIPDIEQQALELLQRSDEGEPATAIFVRANRQMIQQLQVVAAMAHRYGIQTYLELGAEGLRVIAQSQEARVREQRAQARRRLLDTGTDVISAIIDLNDQSGVGIAGLLIYDPTEIADHSQAEKNIVDRIDAPLIIAGPPPADLESPDPSRQSTEKSLYAAIVPAAGSRVPQPIVDMADKPGPEKPPESHRWSKAVFLGAEDLATTIQWLNGLPTVGGDASVRDKLTQRIRVPTKEALIRQGLDPGRVGGEYGAKSYAEGVSQDEFKQALNDPFHEKHALATAVANAWASELERIQDTSGQPRFVTDVEFYIENAVARIRPLPILHVGHGFAEAELASPPDQFFSTNRSVPIFVNLTHHGATRYGSYKVALTAYHHETQQKVVQTANVLLEKDKTIRLVFALKGFPVGNVTYRVSAVSTTIESIRGWMPGSLLPLERNLSIAGGTVQILESANEAQRISRADAQNQIAIARSQVIQRLNTLRSLDALYSGQPPDQIPPPSLDERRQRIHNRFDLWAAVDLREVRLPSGAVRLRDNIQAHPDYSDRLGDVLRLGKLSQTQQRAAVTATIAKAQELIVDLTDRKPRNWRHRLLVRLTVVGGYLVSGYLFSYFLWWLGRGTWGWVQAGADWIRSLAHGTPSTATSRETRTVRTGDLVITSSGGHPRGTEDDTPANQNSRYERLTEVGTQLNIPSPDFAERSMTVGSGQPQRPPLRADDLSEQKDLLPLLADDLSELAAFAQESIGRTLVTRHAAEVGRFDAQILVGSHFGQDPNWLQAIRNELKAIQDAGGTVTTVEGKKGNLATMPANPQWVKVDIRLPERVTKEIWAHVKRLRQLIGAAFVRQKGKQIQADRQVLQVSKTNTPEEIAAFFQRLYADSAKRLTPHRDQGVWVNQDFMAEMYGPVDQELPRAIVAPPIHLDWRPWTVVERAYGKDQYGKDLLALLQEMKQVREGNKSIWKEIFLRDIKRYWFAAPLMWLIRLGLEKRDRPAMTKPRWSPLLPLETWGTWGVLALPLLVFGVKVLPVVLPLAALVILSRAVSLFAASRNVKDTTGWDIPILVVGGLLAFPIVLFLAPWLTVTIGAVIPSVGAVLSSAITAYSAGGIASAFSALVGAGAGFWVFWGLAAFLGARLTLLAAFYGIEFFQFLFAAVVALTVAVPMRIFTGTATHGASPWSWAWLVGTVAVVVGVALIWPSMVAGAGWFLGFGLWGKVALVGTGVIVVVLVLSAVARLIFYPPVGQIPNRLAAINWQAKIIATDLLVPMVVLWQVLGYESSMTMRKLQDTIARRPNVMHPAAFGLGIVVAALAFVLVAMPSFVAPVLGVILILLNFVLNPLFAWVDQDPGRFRSRGWIVGGMVGLFLALFPFLPAAVTGFVMANVGWIVLGTLLAVHVLPAMVVWIVLSVRSLGQFGKQATAVRKQFLEQEQPGIGKGLSWLDRQISRFHGLTDVLFLMRDSAGVPMTLSEPEFQILGAWDQRGRWYLGDIFVKMFQWAGYRIGVSMRHWAHLRLSKQEEFPDLMERLLASREKSWMSSALWRLMEDRFVEKWTGMTATPPLVALRPLDLSTKDDHELNERLKADIAPSFKGAKGRFVMYLQGDVPALILPYTVHEVYEKDVQGDVVSFRMEPELWTRRFVMRGSPGGLAKGQKLAALRSWMYNEGQLRIAPTRQKTALTLSVPEPKEEQYEFFGEQNLRVQHHLETALDSLRDYEGHVAATHFEALTPADALRGHDPRLRRTRTESLWNSLTTKVVPLIVPGPVERKDMDSPVTGSSFGRLLQGREMLMNTLEPSPERPTEFDQVTLADLQGARRADAVRFAGQAAQQLLVGLQGHPLSRVFLHLTADPSANPQTETIHTYPHTAPAGPHLIAVGAQPAGTKHWGNRMPGFGHVPIPLTQPIGVQPRPIPVLLGMTEQQMGEVILNRYLEDRAKKRTHLPFGAYVRSLSPLHPDTDTLFEALTDTRKEAKLGGRWGVPLAELHDEPAGDAAEVRRWAALRQDLRRRDGKDNRTFDQLTAEERSRLREETAVAMRATSGFSSEFKQGRLHLYNTRGFSHRLFTGLLNGLGIGLLTTFFWNPPVGLAIGAAVTALSFFLTPFSRSERGMVIGAVGFVGTLAAMWKIGAIMGTPTLWAMLPGATALGWMAVGVPAIAIGGMLLYVLLSGKGMMGGKEGKDGVRNALRNVLAVGLGYAVLTTVVMGFYFGPALVTALLFGTVIGLWAAYSNGMVPALRATGGRNWPLAGLLVGVTTGIVLSTFSIPWVIPAVTAGSVAAIFFRWLRWLGPPYSEDVRILAELFGRSPRQFDGYWDSASWRLMLGLPWMEGLTYFRLPFWRRGGSMPADAPPLSMMEALLTLMVEERLAPISAFNFLAWRRAYAIMEALTKAEDTQSGYMGVADLWRGTRRGASGPGSPLPPAAMIAKQRMVHLAGEMNHLDGAIRRAAELGLGRGLKDAHQILFGIPLLTGDRSAHEVVLVTPEGVRTEGVVLGVERIEQQMDGETVLRDRFQVRLSGPTAHVSLLVDHDGYVVEGEHQGELLATPYKFLDHVWGLRPFDILQLRFPPLAYGVSNLANQLSGWTAYNLNLRRVNGMFAPGWFENAWETATVLDPDFSIRARQAMEWETRNSSRLLLSIAMGATNPEWKQDLSLLMKNAHAILSEEPVQKALTSRMENAVATLKPVAQGVQLEASAVRDQIRSLIRELKATRRGTDPNQKTDPNQEREDAIVKKLLAQVLPIVRAVLGTQKLPLKAAPSSESVNLLLKLSRVEVNLKSAIDDLKATQEWNLVKKDPRTVWLSRIFENLESMHKFVRVDQNALILRDAAKDLEPILAIVKAREIMAIVKGKPEPESEWSNSLEQLTQVATQSQKALDILVDRGSLIEVKEQGGQKKRVIDKENLKKVGAMVKQLKAVADQVKVVRGTVDALNRLRQKQQADAIRDPDRGLYEEDLDEKLRKSELFIQSWLAAFKQTDSRFAALSETQLAWQERETRSVIRELRQSYNRLKGKNDGVDNFLVMANAVATVHLEPSLSDLVEKLIRSNPTFEPLRGARSDEVRKAVGVALELETPEIQAIRRWLEQGGESQAGLEELSPEPFKFEATGWLALLRADLLPPWARTPLPTLEQVAQYLAQRAGSEPIPAGQPWQLFIEVVLELRGQPEWSELSPDGRRERIHQAMAVMQPAPGTSPPVSPSLSAPSLQGRVSTAEEVQLGAPQAWAGSAAGQVIPVSVAGEGRTSSGRAVVFDPAQVHIRQIVNPDVTGGAWDWTSIRTRPKTEQPGRPLGDLVRDPQQWGAVEVPAGAQLGLAMHGFQMNFWEPQGFLITQGRLVAIPGVTWSHQPEVFVLDAGQPGLRRLNLTDGIPQVDGIQEAMAGPVLIRNGQEVSEQIEQYPAGSPDPNRVTWDPRTTAAAFSALGRTSDNRLIFLSLAGEPQTGLRQATVGDMAQAMTKLGATEAILLGGSMDVQQWVAGDGEKPGLLGRHNNDSHESERPLNAAILVYAAGLEQVTAGTQLRSPVTETGNIPAQSTRLGPSANLPETRVVVVSAQAAAGTELEEVAGRFLEIGNNRLLVLPPGAGLDEVSSWMTTLLAASPSVVVLLGNSADFSRVMAMLDGLVPMEVVDRTGTTLLELIRQIFANLAGVAPEAISNDQLAGMEEALGLGVQL